MARRTLQDALKTKEKILKTAIKKLAEEGYEKISLNKLAHECDVTRGAVYHHFANKEALFLEAVKRLLEEMAGTIYRWAQSGPSHGEDLMESLLYGTKGFLTESQSVEYQRIILLDAPAVLGIERWQKLDDEFTTSTLVDAFSQMKSDADPYDTEVLAQAFSGAMNQLSRWISNDEEILSAYAHLERMLLSFFQTE